MKKTIKKELNRLFPNSGIQTIHGKFSMRFELGGEGNKDNLRRIKQATVRGTEIFKQLIGEDELFLTIQAWKNEFFDPNNQNKNYLFQILKGMELKKKKGPFEQVYYKEDENGIKQEHIFEDPLKCDLFLGKATLSLEKISLIIKGIASLEMGEKPCISQNVFFFAINNNSSDIYPFWGKPDRFY